MILFYLILQNCRFFPANSQFLVYFDPNALLKLVYGGFGVRILSVIAQPLKPTFFVCLFVFFFWGGGGYFFDAV